MKRESPDFNKKGFTAIGKYYHNHLHALWNAVISLAESHR